MNENMLIITGHYGSGKTEYALNTAFKMKAMGRNVTIVDFDIVNPYFRTNDVKDTLKEQGINIIAPMFANTNVDLPALPPEIYSVFSLENSFVIFDVGGDSEGARALGRFKENFDKNGYLMQLVVNTKRPLSMTASEITEIARDIEFTSRLKISALVNSTNLKNETKAADIAKSIPVIDEAAKILNLKQEVICAMEDIKEETEEITGRKIMPIKIYLQNF